MYVKGNNKSMIEVDHVITEAPTVCDNKYDKIGAKL